MRASRDICKVIMVDICEKKLLKCEFVVTSHNRLCLLRNRPVWRDFAVGNVPAQIEFSLLVVEVLAMGRYKSLNGSSMCCTGVTYLQN